MLVEPILLLVFNKNLAGFVTFYFALFCLACSNIVRTYEMLLTYDLHIRNTDPCFHFVSCYEKHFWSQMKNAVSYQRELTVCSLRVVYTSSNK